jgi:WD40 repeat protein
VAAGTSDGKVVLSDLGEMDKPRQLPGLHEGGLGFLMFSPKGKHLVSVAGSELKLWDLENIQLLTTLEVYGEARPEFTVDFSPDGTTLAFGCQEEPGKVYSLKLWDLTRKTLATLDRRTSPIASSVFSPDGAMLASGNWDGEIKIWSVRTGTQLPYTIEGHTNTISSLAFSPRGTRLASTGGDGTVKLWDVNTGDQTITLKGHRSRFSSVAFSPDGTILVSADGVDTVKLWRAATKDEVRTADW